MGYYTRFDMEVRDTKNYAWVGRKVEDALAKELVKVIDMEECFEEGKVTMDGLFYDEMKWYDCEEDMKKFSKEHPEYIFVLYGEGEDRDDNWRAVFYNGVENYTEAHISFPHLNYDEFVNSNKPQGAADQESLTKDE